MKKTIRDNQNFPIGYAETTQKKGSTFEGANSAGYSVVGRVAETLFSLDVSERDEIIEIGEIA